MKLPSLSSVAIAVVSAASLVVFGATGGNLGVALLPLGLVIAGVALVRAPLHLFGQGLLFVALVTDDPRGNPASGLWKNPLYPLGALLFDNLNNVTGIDALRFALIEVVIAVVLIAAIARTRGDPRPRVPRPLAIATTAATACVVALEIWGMARGGDFRASLWQIRQLFWIGPITWVFFLTLRGEEDLPALLRIVLLSACVKAVEAIWLVRVVCRPLGVRPATANTHADTVLYVMAVVLLLAGVLEIRSRRAWLWAAGLLPLLGLGLFFNNRRLAYVSLTGSLVLVYALFPPGVVKRRVQLLAAVTAPLAALYVLIGQNSSSVLFAPAVKVASLFSRQDHSAVGRDIENWDLVQTLKARPFFGWGFGHEYLEIQKADPIKDIFPLYRFIAHNSVLWQWVLGGLVGFTLLWMPLVLTAWFAMRAYRTSHVPSVRVAALVCACVVVAHEVQQYGDMGSQAWLGAFFFGAASAMAGKLAMASGGWPSRNS